MKNMSKQQQHSLELFHLQNRQRIANASIKIEDTLITLHYPKLFSTQEQGDLQFRAEKELWKEVALEFFLASTEHSYYFELNIQPLTREYNYYVFKNYRERILKEKKELSMLTLTEDKDHYVVHFSMNDISASFDIKNLKFNLFYLTLIDGPAYYASSNQFQLSTFDFHLKKVYYSF
jgi:hypothetical protein